MQGSAASNGPAVPHITIVADGSAHGGNQYRRDLQHQRAMEEENAAEEHSANTSHAKSAVSTVLETDKGSGVQAGGGGGLAAANARVLIEEPTTYFSWSVYFTSYFKKWKGGLDTSLPFPSLADCFWSFVGAFLGILAISALNQWVSPEIDIALLVGSFGASAVLVFGMLESKMAQPRNFVGGQLLSALVGITVRVIIPKPWIAAPVGMSLALVVMMLTRTTHPPGGATALIAASMTQLPKWHGYAYLVTVAVGTVVMQLIALVVNNLAPHRRYPTFWY